MADRKRGWGPFRDRLDPKTGDVLAPSEQFSWAVQRVMRRWTFVAAYSALTLAWWLVPRYFPDGLAGWNYWASYMALLIESAVGIGVFGMTIRDHLTLREIKRGVEVSQANGERLASLHEDLLAHVAASESRHDDAIATMSGGFEALARHLSEQMDNISAHGKPASVRAVERTADDVEGARGGPSGALQAPQG